MTTNSKLRLLVMCSFLLASGCDSGKSDDFPVESNSTSESGTDTNESSMDTNEVDVTQQGSETSTQDEATGEDADVSIDEENQSTVELMEDEYPTNPAEISMTWDASMVTIPNGNGGIISGTIDELSNSILENDTKLPVAVYLHGCSGFFSGDDFRMSWLARQGFVTVAPDSFARSFYPESCNVSTREGWKYKPTIEMRQNDAKYALEQIRSFPWVDQDNVYIYGFSEGGLTAVTLNSSNPLHRTKARVVEGWNCVSIPWEEYTGISSPDTEPLLTLFADQDPWLRGEELAESCANFISETNGSQSILIDYAPLNTMHTLLEAPEIQEIVLNFLLQQQSLP